MHVKHTETKKKVRPAYIYEKWQVLAYDGECDKNTGDVCCEYQQSVTQWISSTGSAIKEVYYCFIEIGIWYFTERNETWHFIIYIQRTRLKETCIYTGDDVIKEIKRN